MSITKILLRHAHIGSCIACIALHCTHHCYYPHPTLIRPRSPMLQSRFSWLQSVLSAPAQEPRQPRLLTRSC